MTGTCPSPKGGPADRRGGARVPIPLRGVRAPGDRSDGLWHAGPDLSTSALPETAGDAALLVDPCDRRHRGRAWSASSRTRALRERLRDAGTVRAAASIGTTPPGERQRSSPRVPMTANGVSVRRPARVRPYGSASIASARCPLRSRTRWNAARSSSSETDDLILRADLLHRVPRPRTRSPGSRAARPARARRTTTPAYTEAQAVRGAHPGVEVLVALEPLDEAHAAPSVPRARETPPRRRGSRRGIAHRSHDHEPARTIRPRERPHGAIETLPRVEEARAEEERFGRVETEVMSGSRCLSAGRRRGPRPGDRGSRRACCIR